MFSLLRAESSFAVVSCSQAAAIGAWSDAIDPPEGGGELARAAKAAGQGNLSKTQPPIRHQLLGAGNSDVANNRSIV